MLYGKFTDRIEKIHAGEKKKKLLVNGARQIGKSHIIRDVSKKLFKNYIEIYCLPDTNSFLKTVHTIVRMR